MCHRKWGRGWRMISFTLPHTSQFLESVCCSQTTHNTVDERCWCYWAWAPELTTPMFSEWKLRRWWCSHQWKANKGGFWNRLLMYLPINPLSLKYQLVKLLLLLRQQRKLVTQHHKKLWWPCSRSLILYHFSSKLTSFKSVLKVLSALFLKVWHQLPTLLPML